MDQHLPLPEGELIRFILLCVILGQILVDLFCITRIPDLRIDPVPGTGIFIKTGFTGYLLLVFPTDLLCTFPVIHP